MQQLEDQPHPDGEQHIAHTGRQYADPVPIDLIVDDKENIQPIRQGRSAQTLSHLFAAQPDARALELQNQHRQFQHDIANSEDDDDPLDIHVRYIQWIVENYPQGAGQGHDSNLLPALEQALKTFKGDDRYRNDPRYVRLYVQYSTIVEDPDHIFKYMLANNIGVQQAMLYEEYAEFLEEMQNYEGAREILTLGINRRAMPLSRLRKNFADFEQRAQKAEEEAEKRAIDEALIRGDSPQGTSGQGSTVQAQRRVLGHKVSRTESVSTNSSAHHGGLNTLTRAPSTSRPSTAPSSFGQQGGSSKSQRPNGKLTVFSDAAGSSSSSLTGAGAGRIGSTLQRHQPQQQYIHHHHHHQEPSQHQEEQESISEPWRDMGTEQVRRKENMQHGTSWQGVTLPANMSIAKKPVRKLEVFQDATPETQNMDEPQVQQPPHIPQVAESGQRSSTKPLPSQLEDIARISNLFPVEISESGRPERLMCDLTEIYAGRNEYSVEEIKARRYYFSDSMSRGMPSPRQSSFTRDTTPENRPLQLTTAFDLMPTTPPHPGYSDDDGPPQQPLQNPIKTIEPILPVSEEQMERRKRIAEHQRKLRDSPTMHTIEANAYMSRMFSADYRVKKRKKEDNLSDDARSELDDPMRPYSEDDSDWDDMPDDDCGELTLAIREMRRNEDFERRQSFVGTVPTDLTTVIAQQRRYEDSKG
ncbi:Mitotic spindle checkpoint component mad3 [Podila epigama]|nr:Mitotic spindle checkpoint component mad3 [Podila epigama]